LRDRYQEFTAKGAGIVAIGMGTPDKAARFAKTRDIPFPLLADRTRESYRALNIRRGSWMEVSGPRVWWKGLKSIAGGEIQAPCREAPKQLGGVAVVDKGGEILLVHRSHDSSDNLPADELLDALP
jgi:hypothetical protein